MATICNVPHTPPFYTRTRRRRRRRLGQARETELRGARRNGSPADVEAERIMSLPPDKQAELEGEWRLAREGRE